MWTVRRRVLASWGWVPCIDLLNAGAFGHGGSVVNRAALPSVLLSRVQQDDSRPSSPVQATVSQGELSSGPKGHCS